jgi:hypothetical protein
VPTALESETYCSLSGAPTNGTAVHFLDADLAKWRGPYLTRDFDKTVTIAYGSTLIKNKLSYISGAPSYIRIDLTEIPADVGEAIEEILDGPVIDSNTSYNDGIFTYDAANEAGTYRIPVPTCS